MRQRAATALAIAATSTAAVLSAVAGWERGGTTTEGLLWIAVGVVLVAAAHLLPALCLPAPHVLRGVVALVWLVAIVGVMYGHATFFMLAQQHAGDRRFAQSLTKSAFSLTVAPATDDVLKPGADRIAAARERADLTGHLAQTHTPATRGTLSARIAALDVRLEEDRRAEAAFDRVSERADTQLDQALAERDAARHDPVLDSAAALLGLPESRLDLATGMLLAMAIEGVGIVCWILALLPRYSPQNLVVQGELQSVRASDTGESSDALKGSSAPSIGTSMARNELERLRAAIDAGDLRPTLAGIRRFMNCSQQRASTLRRQLLGEDA